MLHAYFTRPNIFPHLKRATTTGNEIEQSGWNSKSEDSNHALIDRASPLWDLSVGFPELGVVGRLSHYVINRIWIYPTRNVYYLSFTCILIYGFCLYCPYTPKFE